MVPIIRFKLAKGGDVIVAVRSALQDPDGGRVRVYELGESGGWLEPQDGILLTDIEEAMAASMQIRMVGRVRSISGGGT